MISAKDQFKKNMQDPGFLTWYNTLDEELKEMCQKYPFAAYKMKKDSPYSIPCPGTIVYLHSLLDKNEVKVVIKGKDKLPYALEYEEKQWEIHKHKYPGKTLEDFHRQDVAKIVDGKYLEPYFNF